MQRASHCPSLMKDLLGAGCRHSPACKGLRGEEPLKLGGCCPRCTSLTAFIPNNISWRQSFLGNKSGGRGNLCDGLPSHVSRCKYVGIKEYVFLAPDLKTYSVQRLSQQPKDPRQTNTLPGQRRVLSAPAREASVQMHTGSCWIEVDCRQFTHSRGSKWKHIFCSECVTVLLFLFLLFLNLLAFDENEKQDELCFLLSHSRQALWETLVSLVCSLLNINYQGRTESPFCSPSTLPNTKKYKIYHRTFFQIFCCASHLC